MSEYSAVFTFEFCQKCSDFVVVSTWTHGKLASW